MMLLTSPLFLTSVGNTSPIFLSTNTPPINLKHFLSLSNLFKVSITILQQYKVIN